jgi:Domain of unknown function (DUF4407)
VGSFLIWLSGARPDVLAQVPVERLRFQRIGWAVLITAFLGPLLGYLLYADGIVPLPAAVITGIVLTILFLFPGLDRQFIVSSSEIWVSLLRGILRVVLGVGLGFLAAVLLSLQVFRVPIVAQVAEIQRQAATKFQEDLKNSALAAEVERLRATVNIYQQVVTTGGTSPIDIAQDPTILALQTQLKGAQQTAIAAYKAMTCQEFGCPGVPAGFGPAFRADQENYNVDEQRIQTLEGEITNRKALLTQETAADERARKAEAVAALPGAEGLLEQDEQRLQADQVAYNQANSGRADLLVQIDAFDQLSAQNATVNAARYLFGLLFVAIETLPLTVRLLNKGGLYEQVIEVLEPAHERRLGDADRFRRRVLATLRDDGAPSVYPLSIRVPESADQDYDRALRDMGRPPPGNRAGSGSSLLPQQSDRA